MVPFSSFSTTSWGGTIQALCNAIWDTVLCNYKLTLSMVKSSGQAMKDIEQLVGQQEGLGLLWTGLLSRAAID